MNALELNALELMSLKKDSVSGSLCIFLCLCMQAHKITRNVSTVTGIYLLLIFYLYYSICF